MRRTHNAIALVVSALCSASMADDQIQIINIDWEWPDQGLGLWDPNGDTVGGAIVREMVIYGPDLVVVGAFNYAGGIPATHVALWNGSVWSAVGNTFPSSSVRTVLVAEKIIYIGGVFNKMGQLR